MRDLEDTRSLPDLIRESAERRRLQTAETLLAELAPPEPATPEPGKPSAAPRRPPQPPRPQPRPPQPQPPQPGAAPLQDPAEQQPEPSPRDPRPYPGDMSDASPGDLIYDAIDGFDGGDGGDFFDLPLQRAQDVLQLPGRPDPAAANAWGGLSRIDRARVIDMVADQPGLPLGDAIRQLQAPPGADSIDGGTGDDPLTLRVPGLSPEQPAPGLDWWQEGPLARPEPKPELPADRTDAATADWIWQTTEWIGDALPSLTLDQFAQAYELPADAVTDRTRQDFDALSFAGRNELIKRLSADPMADMAAVIEQMKAEGGPADGRPDPAAAGAGGMTWDRMAEAQGWTGERAQVSPEVQRVFDRLNDAGRQELIARARQDSRARLAFLIEEVAGESDQYTSTGDTSPEAVQARRDGITRAIEGAGGAEAFYGQDLFDVSFAANFSGKYTNETEAAWQALDVPQREAVVQQMIDGRHMQDAIEAVAGGADSIDGGQGDDTLAPEFSDPARAREFEDMPPELQQQIRKGLADGIPEDELFNPEGDLRSLLNDTLGGGQGDDTLAGGDSLWWRVAKDVGTGLLAESSTQIVGGALDAGDAMLSGVHDLSDWVNADPMRKRIKDAALAAIPGGRPGDVVGNIALDWMEGDDGRHLPEVREARSVTGSLVRGLAQFVTGFAVGSKGLSSVGWVASGGGKVSATRAMTQAALADFMAFDGHEARLSDMIQEFPALQNPVTDYLQSDMSDTELEGRLKNVAEGVLSDIPLSALVSGVSAGLGAIRRARQVRDAGSLKSYREAGRRMANDTRLGQNVLPDADKMAVPDLPLFTPSRISPLGQDQSPRTLGREINAYLKSVGAKVDKDDPLSVSLNELRTGRRKLGMARPVANVIKGLGGIDPSGPLAAELRTRDITPRTFPALFKVGGRKNLDNIPVNEQPIFQVRGLDDGNGYIPEQAWIDALEAEANRRPWQVLADEAKQAEADALDVLADDLDRIGVDWRNATDDEVRAALEAERRTALEMEGLDALVDSQPRAVDVEDMLTQARVKRYLRDKEVSRLAEGDEPVRLANGDRQALVSPSPDEPGRWRITYLDADGPAGHVTADTKAEALTRAMEDRYFAEGAPDELRALPGDIPPDPTTTPRSEADLADELMQRDLADNPHVSEVGEGKSKIFVNWGRIASEHDVRALIQKMADMAEEEINVARRGKTRGWDKVKADANDENAWRILAERRQGQPLNDAQSLAVRRLWTASGERLAEAARAVAKAPTPQNSFMFRRAMALHGTIQREVISARTETARALRQWALPAGPSEWVARQMEDMVMLHGDTDVSKDLAQKITAALDEGRRDTADKLARKSATLSTLDAVLEYWISAILSGPKTHLRNIMSNTGVVFHLQAERAAAARIGQVRGTVDGYEVGEAAAMLHGTFASLGEAFRNAGRAARTGESGFGIGKLEMERGRKLSTEYLGDTKNRTFNAAVNAPIVSHGINALGSVMGTFTRALTVEDEFFKTVNFRAELNALAFRKAQQELRGGQIAPVEMKARIADLVDEPEDQMLEAAREYAQMATFTNRPGNLAGLINKFRQSYPVARLIVPFVNTPANIFRYISDRTPLGLTPALSDFRSDYAAGGMRRDMAIAKMGMGSAALMAAYDLALNGQVSGSGPTSRSERDAMYRMGWQPNAVRPGGGEWSFGYVGLDPLGTILGLGANLAEMTLMGDGDLDEGYDDAIYHVMAAVGETLMDKSYFAGLASFFSVMADSKRYSESFGQNLVKSFAVPAIVREIETVVDPRLSDAASTIDAIKSAVPGLGGSVPTKRDYWGREITFESGMGWLYDMASPAYARKLDPQPIDREFMRLNSFPGMPTRKIMDGGITYSLDERRDIYNRYLELRGQTRASDFQVKLTTRGKPNADSQRRIDSGDRTLLEALNDLVTGKHPYSEEYDSLSPEGKKKLTEKLVSAYQQGAKAKLFAEFPDFFGNPKLREHRPSPFTAFIEVQDD